MKQVTDYNELKPRQIVYFDYGTHREKFIVVKCFPDGVSFCFTFGNKNDGVFLYNGEKKVYTEGEFISKFKWALK